MSLLVTELTKTCNACPSQWSGKLADGGWLYARYRNGWFSIEVDNVEVLGDEVGRPMEGHMSTREMMRRTDHLFEWSALRVALQANSID